MRVSPFITFFLACLCLLAHRAAAQSRSDDFAGYVLKINGSWRVAPQFQSDLGPGYGLRSTDRIERRSAGLEDYIFIGMLDGSVVSRECSGTVVCMEIVVGPVAPEPSLSTRFRKLWNLLHPPPLPPEIIASRGTTEPHELHEAVLLSSSSRTDVAPALADVRLGVWDAEFRPLGKAGQTIHANLQWLPPNAKLDRVILPGLYALRLAEDNTGTNAGTNTAVVLITHDKTDANLFTEALRWTNIHKGSSLPADARQYFLRSVLYELDRRHSPSK